MYRTRRKLKPIERQRRKEANTSETENDDEVIVFGERVMLPMLFNINALIIKHLNNVKHYSQSFNLTNIVQYMIMK